MMDCIDLCERNYDSVVDHYKSNYDTVEFSYKRIKFAYWDHTLAKVDHHMLLVSYVASSGFFGEKWKYTLYDNYDESQFSRWDDVDRYIYEKYAAYNPVGTVELSTENFYKGARFWEAISGEDDNW